MNTSALLSGEIVFTLHVHLLSGATPGPKATQSLIDLHIILHRWWRC